jgi:3-isopropylmalate dehydrogenase
MPQSYKLLFLPGDGIGPEVTAEVEKVARALSADGVLGFEIEYADIGGAGYDAHRDPYPDETAYRVKEADAVMLGAVGGPKWVDVPFDKRPEQGLLDIRKDMNLYANLRPAFVFDQLIGASSLKEHIIKGLDVMIVRELIGGVYFGQPRGIEDLGGGKKRGYNTASYSTDEVTRVAEVAFTIAKARNKTLCSIDKANVLESMIVWRETVTAVGKKHPDVALSHMYVDNAAMQLATRPSQFDVMLCPNLAGDILSDLAAAMTGSLGMLPSASLGDKQPNGLPYALYEPVHGSAPDIAGQSKANPLAAILSFEMLLRYSLGAHATADALRTAVGDVLDTFRTPDIMEDGKIKVDTATMGDQVVARLRKQLAKVA